MLLSFLCKIGNCFVILKCKVCDPFVLLSSTDPFCPFSVHVFFRVYWVARWGRQPLRQMEIDSWLLGFDFVSWENLIMRARWGLAKSWGRRAGEACCVFSCMHTDSFTLLFLSSQLMRTSQQRSCRTTVPTELLQFFVTIRGHHPKLLRSQWWTCSLRYCRSGWRGSKITGTPSAVDR